MRAALGFLSGSIRGHYRTAGLSGLTTGMAANAPIFSFRNANAGSIRCLLQRLRMQMQIVTAFTASQEISCAAYVARSFSAAATGGASLNLAAPYGMLNSISDIAPVATINVAAAAALTAGTRTLDPQPFLFCPGAQTFTTSSAVQASPFVEEYVLNSDQQYPLNLIGGALPPNQPGNFFGPEGIVIASNIAQGAAGTVRFCFEIEWIEYDASSAPGNMG